MDKKKAKAPAAKDDSVQTAENKPVQGYVLPPKQKKSLLRAYLNHKATGTRYELSDTMTRIGRDRANTIALIGDSYISRNHAWILRAQDGYWLEDLGSTNTTLLNGKPVTERMQIVAGDKLTLGKTELLFSIEK